VNVQVIAPVVNAQIANKLVSIVMNVIALTVTVQTLLKDNGCKKL
tara:strand:+ start:48 stop:182 length:135 start_codon:yes stop_codon:yes gene_type:complete